MYWKILVWFDERSKKTQTVTKVEFYICCQKGKGDLPFLQKPSPLFFGLISNEDPRSNQFKENLRAYNSMFAFTSIGEKIQSFVNDGGGCPQFILGGQNYHYIGSLLSNDEFQSKFVQLYIYVTKNELNNRAKPFG